jgi:hypothetical protein
MVWDEYGVWMNGWREYCRGGVVCGLWFESVEKREWGITGE